MIDKRGRGRLKSSATSWWNEWAWSSHSGNLETIIADAMSTTQKTDLSHASNPIYLRQQYSDAERLNIRREAHRLYTENDEPWADWVLARVAPVAGERLVDIGCGAGHLSRPAGGRRRLCHRPGCLLRYARWKRVARVRPGPTDSTRSGRRRAPAAGVGLASIASWPTTCCITCATSTQRWRRWFACCALAAACDHRHQQRRCQSAAHATSSRGGPSSWLSGVARRRLSV